MFLRSSKCFPALVVLSSVCIAVLVAQNLFALPFPFPRVLDWALGIVAVLSLLTAKRIYRDGSQDVELRTAAANCPDLRSDLQLTAGDACFTVDEATDGSVTLWINCFWKCTNMGPSTILVFEGCQTTGVSTRDNMFRPSLVFGSTRSDVYPQLRIDSGASGTLQCHIGIAIENEGRLNHQTITIEVSLKEAFSDALQLYRFSALNKPEKVNLAAAG